MLPWTSKLGIKFPPNIKISHRITPSSNKDAAVGGPPPLRGMFTDTKISKGQLLSIIPLHESVILPQTAARYLMLASSSNKTDSSSALSSSSSSNSIYKAALAMTSLNPVEVIPHHNPHSRESQLIALPWFSRDQIIIATALAMWKLSSSSSSLFNNAARNRSQNDASTPTSPSSSFFQFDDYLKALPRSVPFSASEKRRQQVISSLEQEQSQNKNNNKSKSTTLNINRFATPLDVRPSLSGAAGDTLGGATSEEVMMRNRRKSSSLSSSGIPTSSLNLEEALTSSNHLTQVEHIGLLGKSLNFLSSTFARAVVNSDEINQPTQQANENEKLLYYREARTAFDWAHFMIRSRSICPLLSLAEHHESDNQNHHDDDLSMRMLSSSSPLLIPFVDMFNHNMRNSNVTVSWNRGTSLANAKNPNDKEVLVTATRDIEPGEELLLNYANHKQRGRFMFSPDSLELRLSKKGMINDSIDHADEEESDATTAEERRQIYERLPVQKLLTAQRRSGVCEDLLSWEWQYGFPIPNDELEYVRELLWANSLKGRVQRMMDVRRRGRPGEFVVGVPEGLQSLKRHRERIERELYGGTRIFPPQAE